MSSRYQLVVTERRTRVPAAPRARTGDDIDGRSPGSRVRAAAPPSRGPFRAHPVALWGRRSPLTVAGAAAVEHWSIGTSAFRVPSSSPRGTVDP